jgi:hypothetical protein
MVQRFLESEVYDERLFLGAWQKRLLINCRYFIENVPYASWMTLPVPINTQERSASSVPDLTE